MPEEYGPYQLVKKLATGGMAQIYLARHQGNEGFERLCVVKRILPHLAENEDFIQTFLDEAIIAARLDHPNIVQIHDLGTQDDSYFLALEYIHGEDLRRIWKRAGQLGLELPIPIALRVVADAAAGLDYAHKRVDNGRALDIVHRDLSPQNILVSFDGAVKVVGFGIARAVDKMSHTRSGVLKGKYSYMSPEQAAGANEVRVDHRTDIFALGVVLYELLTGTRLFKRADDLQTLSAVMECRVAPPSEVNARVPRDLDAVVMKALRKRPEDRYGDARELQLAIENWLVTHQQPASTAHVAEFMRSLFQDRLTEEQRVGGPVTAASAPRSDTGQEPAAVRRRRSASGRSMKVAVAVAALIGVAAVMVMVLRPPPAAAVVPARVEAPAPVVEAPPVAPLKVKVTFATEPDMQLPSGIYECTITNPDLGTRRERVEVRPDDLSKVTVRFEPGPVR